jgi:hypothetical protein
MSLPHPDSLVKAGVKKMTAFGVRLDEGLLTEMVFAGGILPILAQKPDGEILVGHLLVAPENGELPMNPFGDIIGQAVFANGLDELGEARFLVTNRDGGWAYTLTGWEIRDGKKKDQPAYKSLPYDGEKFDKDKAYRQEFFGRFGMTLHDLDRFWQGYYQYYGGQFEGNTIEVAIGSLDWQQYVESLVGPNGLMPKKYSMPNGEIRVSYLDLDTFRDLATEYTGINGSERWLKRAGLPLGIAAMTSGYGAVAIVASSLGGQGLAAGIDDSWKGYYGRAKIIRHELAPYFRLLASAYKKRLNQWREIAEAQRQELTRLRGEPSRVAYQSK